MIRIHTRPLRATALVIAMAAMTIAPSVSRGGGLARSVSRGAGARRHVHLVKSAPAANDTTLAPTAIRFWFSEKVALGVTRVKLANAAGGAVVLGKLARSSANDGATVLAPIPSPLAAGAYVISWSTAGDDGHPSKGTIDFVVKSAR